VQGQNAGLARYTAGRNQLYQDYLTSRTKGQQAANFGASGVAGLSGTPGDVMADTEAAARFDAFNRFYAGEQEAKQAGTQADYDRRAAKAAREAADTSSTSDILGGIGAALKVAPLLFAL
jgi:membrane protein involved in colicin uptake